MALNGFTSVNVVFAELSANTHFKAVYILSLVFLFFCFHFDFDL